MYAWPQTLCVDAKKGGKIVNSQQQVDGDAWAQRAPWVDYHGPIDGHTVGIAIFNHPSSFRYPTYWHVRTYGLFAANPFGFKDFSDGKLTGGAHTILPGETHESALPGIPASWRRGGRQRRRGVFCLL